jgi:hypothetical protein
MSTSTRLAALAVLAAAAAVAACGERTTPTGTSEEPGPSVRRVAAPADNAPRREALARRVARALADPAFRARVKQDLDRSPFREHKLHFQRYLSQGDRSVAADVARLNGEAPSTVEAEAAAAIPLELYLPVPEHRARWAGGDDILVATALRDHEAPVAFDVQGRRQVLSPDRPPVTPVLALVPVETDFDPARAALRTGELAICPYGQPGAVNPQGCGGGFTPDPTLPGGLHMTYASFVGTFEGWLKGEPEFEVHILGQAGTTDSLKDYQCAGEKAGGPYYFDQNSPTWSGDVVLFSQAQIDAYRQQHPGQSLRIEVIEDDDEACVIKLDAGRLANILKTLDAQYASLTGGRDTTLTTLQRLWNRATAFQKILQAFWSFILTQDDFVGNAVQDAVAGQTWPGANWIVKGENNVTNGGLKLVIK